MNVKKVCVGGRHNDIIFILWRTKETKSESSKDSNITRIDFFSADGLSRYFSAMNSSELFSTCDNVIKMWCCFEDTLFQGPNIFTNKFTAYNLFKVNAYPTYITRNKL